MNARLVAACGALALAPVLASAGSDAPPPPDTTTVTLGSSSMPLWPYTGTDFSGTPSDPVNLFFLDTDPRQLRQALLRLSGHRPPIAPVALPFDDCRWMDGMGSEQTGWAEPRGWVGGEVQLVCTHPTAPLGDPFRIHVRLFRQGPHTVGAAHLDILIPGTAQHESLSWDLARDFVAADMQRLRHAEAPQVVPLITPCVFGTVPRLLYDALVGADPQLAAFLGLLGISPDNADGGGNPYIPTSGNALAFSPHLSQRIHAGARRATTTVQYQTIIPRPFCNSGSPLDFVLLQGPVQLEQAVRVDHRGRYTRSYRIYGELSVTPWNPLTMLPTGAPSPAVVQERHRAVLTNRHGQVFEQGSQTVMGDPEQSYSWLLAAGARDHFKAQVVCGP